MEEVRSVREFIDRHGGPWLLVYWLSLNVPSYRRAWLVAPMVLTGRNSLGSRESVVVSAMTKSWCDGDREGDELSRRAGGGRERLGVTSSSGCDRGPGKPAMRWRVVRGRRAGGCEVGRLALPKRSLASLGHGLETRDDEAAVVTIGCGRAAPPPSPANLGARRRWGRGRTGGNGRHG
jgi:hypothetical protein